MYDKNDLQLRFEIPGEVNPNGLNKQRTTSYLTTALQTFVIRWQDSGQSTLERVREPDHIESHV